MTRPARQPRRRRGVMLLEVILAIALLAVAAGVIYTGLSGSDRAVRRLALNGQAADLAATVISQLQMGTLELVSDGPVEAEAPHDGWTWETIVDDQPGRDEIEPDLLRVEVVVHHVEADYTHRIVQWLAPPAAGEQGP